MNIKLAAVMILALLASQCSAGQTCLVSRIDQQIVSYIEADTAIRQALYLQGLRLPLYVPSYHSEWPIPAHEILFSMGVQQLRDSVKRYYEAKHLPRVFNTDTALDCLSWNVGNVSRTADPTYYLQITKSVVDQRLDALIVLAWVTVNPQRYTAAEDVGHYGGMPYFYAFVFGYDGQILAVESGPSQQ